MAKTRVNLWINMQCMHDAVLKRTYADRSPVSFWQLPKTCHWSELNSPLTYKIHMKCHICYPIFPLRMMEEGIL